MVSDAAPLSKGLRESLGLGDGGTWRDAACQPDIPTNRGSLPDGYPAQDCCSRIDNDIVFNDRMSGLTLHKMSMLIDGKVLGTQGDGLVKTHIITDDGRPPDHNARAMIDEEAATNDSAGMNINTRGGMGQLSNDTSHYWCTEAVKSMGKTMVGDGLHPWVADKHLLDTAGGRVASERRMEVGVELGTDARKLMGKSDNNVRGLLIKSRILPVAMGQGSAGLELNADLMAKVPKAGVEGMADEAVGGRRRAWYTHQIGLRQPQSMGIEGGSQADEYLFESMG